MKDIQNIEYEFQVKEIDIEIQRIELEIARLKLEKEKLSYNKIYLAENLINQGFEQVDSVDTVTTDTSNFLEEVKPRRLKKND